MRGLAWIAAGGLALAPMALSALCPARGQDALPPSPPPPDSAVAAPTAAPLAPATLTIVSPAAIFEQGLAAYQAGRYPEAIKILANFLAKFPQDRHREEALFRLAESYRNLNALGDALAAYTFQVANFPEGPLYLNAQLRRGAILFSTGKTSEAITPLQVVVQGAVGELQEAARYLLGRADLETQREAEGVALLGALADATPPGSRAGDAAEALAELADRQHDYPAAEQRWTQALQLLSEPADQAVAAARGGWSALQASRWAAAETLFQTARRLGASGEARRVANTGLLQVLFHDARPADWLSVYQAESSQFLPSAQSAIAYDLGHVYFQLKQWSGAIAAFDQFLHDFPQDPAALGAAYERFLAAAQVAPAQIVAAAEAFQTQWPRSIYRARVELVEAQELSQERRFAPARPLWEELARQPTAPGWPRLAILLQFAQTNDELKLWDQAASTYQAYLDEAPAGPGADGVETARRLRAEARLALCLQNGNQLLGATEAWKTVQAQAPAGSPEQQMALEALGLIAARGGPEAVPEMVRTFRHLLERFPNTKLRGLAAFSVGSDDFTQHHYAAAIPDLRIARQADPTDFLQPATQRLVLAAYGLGQRAEVLTYLAEYDALPLPTDPQALIANRLPAALYYWLAEGARRVRDWPQAERFYAQVTRHPDPGELLPGAFWELGQVQTQLREWPAAVASYSRFRELQPSAKDATSVLLALARAQLGALGFDAARSLANQALLQEPEGPNSAASRMLLGEIAFATHNYAESARFFATVALLFDDPQTAPEAMRRAADAYEQAGNLAAANDWRAKLRAKYPGQSP